MIERIDRRQSSAGNWIVASVVAALVAMTGAFVPAPATAAQQAPRIVYPTPDAMVPGPDVPISIIGGAGSNGGAIEVTLDGTVQDGAEMIGGTVLLTGVAAGDHEIVVRPATGGDSASTDNLTRVAFTVLPVLTPAIRMGICDGFNPKPVAELPELSVVPSEDRSSSGETHPIGVPAAVPVAVSKMDIDEPLDTFLERAHSITVSGSDASDVVVCGEIGGPVIDDTVHFGLSGRDDVAAFGVATLTGDGETTSVVVEVVQTETAPRSLDSERVLPDDVAAVPAAVNQGICAGLAAGAVLELAPLNAGVQPGDTTRDSVRGVVLAPAAIAGASTVDGPLTELLTRANAVVVREPGSPAGDDGPILACGAIGGPVLDGQLRVALLPDQESGYAGTAFFNESGEGLTVDVTLVHGQSVDNEIAVVPTSSPDVTASDPTAGPPPTAVPVAAPPTAVPAAPVEPEVPSEPEVPVEPPAATEVIPEPTEVVPEPTAVIPEPTATAPLPTEVVPAPTEVVPQPTDTVPVPTSESTAEVSSTATLAA